MTGAVLLDVRGLGDGQFLTDVTFNAREGEIVGLAGLQGQGQEELLMTLAGFRRMKTGEVRISGRPTAIRSPRHAISAGMVVIPGNRQTEGLFMDRPVFYNFSFPQVTRPRAPFFISSRRQRKTCSELVAGFSIKTSSLCAPVTSLSGGNAQKVVVSKWLPLGPKVLLMSDPAKGVDVQSKAELYRIIQDLAKKGAAVLLFASDLHELVTHCDRILVLYEGRIVEQVPNAGLDEESLLARCLRRGGPGPQSAGAAPAAEGQ
jgi:ribose transport system ATP-binding protein